VGGGGGSSLCDGGSVAGLAAPRVIMDWW